MQMTLDWNKYLEIAAETVSEGIVMLKNDNDALPLRTDDKVSVFGRIQLHYYKSGTGSGGMVNVSKVTGIIEGLINAGVKLNDELLEIYKKWDAENPYDLGKGWGGEPWSQKEMPLNDDIVKKAAESSSAAIVIIGRTAGEEQDSREEKGSYLLTDEENDMLAKVRKHFSRVIVLLNVGSIIDMSFVDEYSPDAVLYIWQGGMNGGAGTADVLIGKVNPSGKLPDTIAYSVSDYPSAPYFGDKKRNYYTEDIYVGYRWFETFAPEKVRYPFGYGLSYTSFDIELENAGLDTVSLWLYFKVTNKGKYSGKEVVQLYCESPQGKLGKPARVLCGFAKTKLLAPGESQTVIINVPIDELASYDDSGVTGHPYCYVLEEGMYSFFAGTDVRSADFAYKFEMQETVVVRECVQAMAPVENFERIRPEETENGFKPVKENAPVSGIDEAKRRLENLSEEITYTGDKGIKLADVLLNKHTMEEFIAQLSDSALTSIIRGEGMGSPRVTPGTASAFGGVSDELVSFGIPAACCSDGPSGMRLDCGTKAFSLPNGTMIASTFNRTLITGLFELMGMEMTANNVDCLLGPGMNIHRHPLNGRNFEYFSEDPYLTGEMAAAELRGLHNSGVTGTIKHFCANNQETNRHFLESVVSERALREIYLRGFEIAVKEGQADSIMTTYGAINGLWTAGSFDLNNTILRGEWGFNGFTMTDWWANVNDRGCEPSRSNYSAMARARNNVYMVCSDCQTADEGLDASLADGTLTRGELQRNAADICSFLLTTNAMRRLMGSGDTVNIINRPDEDTDSDQPVVFYELNNTLNIVLSGVKSERGKNYSFALTVDTPGFFDVTLTASSELGELAQMPVTMVFMGTPSGTFTWNGTGGKLVSFTTEVPIFSRFTAVRLYFAQNGLDLHSISFELKKQVENMDIAFKEE